MIEADKKKFSNYGGITMTEHVRCIFQTEKKKSNMIYDEEGWDQIRDTWMAQDEALKQIGHSELHRTSKTGQ